MSINSITAALTPSILSVKSGNQFGLEFDLTNTNVKQDPIILTAEMTYTDETGVVQRAEGQSPPINVDRAVLANVVKVTLPAGIVYVAGSAQWNGVTLGADAILENGVLTAIVNQTLVEQSSGKFTAIFAL